MINFEDEKKKRHELLERVSKDLNADLIAAAIREPDPEKGTDAILNVMFDEIGMDGNEALGEFFFLPLRDTGELNLEPKVQHFMAVITIAEELESDHFPELYEAMSYINSIIPCGAYYIDMDKKFLSYKMTVPLPIELSEEEVYKEIHIITATALSMVDLHIDLLLDLMDGETTLDYIKEVLKTKI